jgi:hypothetical protein
MVVLAGVLALGGASAARILAANGGTTIRVGNLIIHAEGVIQPRALPRHQLAPISVHIRGSVASVDGSHVPAVKTIHLQVDRHFRFDSTGLQSCTVTKLEADAPDQALHACPGALIGKGSASAEVEFAESSPFSASGELLAFNGPTVGGYAEQLDYLYVNVPAPTAVVVVGKVAKGSGPYGYEISVTVPKIAGGAGSLTGFDLTLGRKWTYRGHQHSFLSAECPSGSFNNQVEAVFGDGTKLNGTVSNSCRPKG